jgi:large subunit ribosomal protein L10
MSKVRPEKAATVKEVKSRVKATSTAVVTEYRGMTVAQISALRRQLRTLDADFKVYKNTLVLRAIAGSDVESLSEFLTGPTAISFIDGDISAVAKALRDFARETPTLVVKGGVVDGKALTTRDLVALADLPSRDVLLAQFAGLLASPMRTMAGLLKALPQNLAYGLSALLESKGGAPSAPEAAPVVDVEPAEAPEVEVAEVEVSEAEPAEAEVAEVEVTEVEVAEAEVSDGAVEETAEVVVEEAPEASETSVDAEGADHDEPAADVPNAHDANESSE